MKKLFLLPALLFLAAPVSAGVLTLQQKIEVCESLKAANSRGWSGETMLKQVMKQQGQPEWAAGAIMREAKEVCPKAY